MLSPAAAEVGACGAGARLEARAAPAAHVCARRGRAPRRDEYTSVARERRGGRGATRPGCWPTPSIAAPSGAVTGSGGGFPHLPGADIFAAGHDGEPVAVAGTGRLGDIVGVYAVGTRQAQRRRGAAAAAMTAAMDHHVRPRRAPLLPGVGAGRRAAVPGPGVRRGRPPRRCGIVRRV